MVLGRPAEVEDSAEDQLVICKLGELPPATPLQKDLARLPQLIYVSEGSVCTTSGVLQHQHHIRVKFFFMTGRKGKQTLRWHNTDGCGPLARLGALALTGAHCTCFKELEQSSV